jgi:hypothetical protein
MSQCRITYVISYSELPRFGYDYRKSARRWGSSAVKMNSSSSGLLRGLKGYHTDVSGLTTGPVSKDQAVRENS